MIWCKHPLGNLKRYGFILLICLANLTFAGILNPNAHMLQHGEFELTGTLVTNQTTVDEELQRQWPFVTSLEIGVLDRSTFGIQYGDGVSLMGKTLIFEEEGWVPSMALGFRHLFHSQEAHVFQVEDDNKEDWENDIYLQFSRSLESGTSIQGGVNILSALGDGGASPFWGIDWRVMPNLSLDYQAFIREEMAHHNLGLSYVEGGKFAVSLGFLEVQEWLSQDGQLGFFASPERPRTDALFAPGVYFQISIRGLMSKANRSTTQLRLKDLEDRQQKLRDSLSYLRNRLSRTEMLLSEITGPRVVFEEEDETAAAVILDKIVQTYRATPDEVTLLRSLQDSLLAMGEASDAVLTSLAEHPATDDIYRETVIKIMGNSKRKKFAGSILPHLNHSKIIIRREALISLGKIADLSTLDEVRKLTQDKDPIVKIIAEQVVQKIIEKAKEIDAENTNQPSAEQIDSKNPTSPQVVNQATESQPKPQDAPQAQDAPQSQDSPQAKKPPQATTTAVELP